MRLVLSLFIILGASMVAAEEYSFYSENNLQIGQVLDPFSLEIIGQCPVDLTQAPLGAVFSTLRFARIKEIIKPESSGDILSFYDLIKLEEFHEDQLVSSESENIYKFSSLIQGPTYSGEWDKNCRQEFKAGLFVDEMELSARINFSIRLRFKTFSEQLYWEKKLNLKELNLFTFFKRVANIPKRDVSVSLLLEQRGGRISKYLEFQQKHIQSFRGCQSKSWIQCEFLVSALYQYAYSPDGLRKQLLDIANSTSIPGQSIQKYKGERRVEISIQSQKSLSDLKKALRYWSELLEYKNFVLNPFNSFTEVERRKWKRDIAESMEDIFIAAEACFFNIDNCQVEWTSFKEQLAVSKLPEISHPFLELCSRRVADGSPDLFFQPLMSSWEISKCQDLFDRIKASSHLNMSRSRIQDTDPLKYFSHLQVVNLSFNILQNFTGLLSLDHLNKLILKGGHHPEIDELFREFPNLIIEQ